MSRDVINALLPPGAIWSPSDDGDLDLLLDGIADTNTDTQDFLADLSLIRSPEFTPDLEGLELEYGIVPNESIAEADRRIRLLAAKTAGQGDGTDDTMERFLRAAGFDVYVHKNNPPVDPTLLGGVGAELVVNGPTYEHDFISGSLFGGDGAFFGRTVTMFGAGEFGQKLIEYEVPVDSGYWPLVFFVGGLATRNVSGEITAIADADVDLERMDELISLVVKYKPIHAWSWFVINYV